MIPRKSPPQSAASEMLEAAREYMNLGFKVVILKPGEKVPLTRHGVKDATDDFETFKRLMPASGGFNIGIAMGSASDVIAGDIDPRNGGLQEFKTLTQRFGPLPNTLICETGGGGRHFYFQLPPGGMKKKLLGPGVDLLAEGSFAVAPPSQHPSGKRYRWLGGRGPDKQKIAPLPDTWRQFIDADKREKSDPVAPAGDEIRQGSRNIELTRIAGQLRRSGLSEADMLFALRGVNKSRCHPPVDDDEVAQIARNVAQYASGEGPRDQGQKVAQTLLDAEFAGGSWLRYEQDGYFWAFADTQWVILPDKILQKKILKTVNTKFSSVKPALLVQEVYGLLRIKQSCDDDLLHFKSKPPNVVNLLNCELWLGEDGTIEKRAHNPTTGMRHVLKINYDPAATCLEYDRAVKQIFQNAEYPNTLVMFFSELLGYAIQLERNIPVIIVMVGEGSNGKTSLIKVLIALVGPDFVHSGRVEELEEGRFGIGYLFGKLLFLDDDVRAGAKLPDGTLKKISEPKIQTGQHKFKHPFNFLNLAFPVLLCNNTPSLADLSYGMMRRLLVLPFGYKFHDDETDEHLFDRIIRDELSGVLNRALQGWQRLKRRKRFPTSIDMKLARSELLVHANPLKGFIDECCVEDPKGKVSLEDFYDAYREWAGRSGYTLTQVKSTVKKNLQHQGYVITRHGVGLVVIGLKLR